MSQKTFNVMVIGAGPAGLMAAEVLSAAGCQVTVYEHKPSAARKLLMAGKSGLNISHDGTSDQFLMHYDAKDWLSPMISAFDNQAMMAWMQELGITPYIGSSGRIFPQEMKAAPLLRAWLARLRQAGVQFVYRARWQGINAQGVHQIEHEGRLSLVSTDAVVLAVGGGSWARLGSDGQAVDWLVSHGVDVAPFVPSNCGVLVAWSAHMTALVGSPLKRVAIWVEGHAPKQAEAVISHYGLEGGGIYPWSTLIRQQLAQQPHATLYIDLLPDLSFAQIEQKLIRASKDSLSNRLRKAGLDACKSALLREIVPKKDWNNPQVMAHAIKALSIRVDGLSPIDEAISTAGGVMQDALDARLMLKLYAGVFCCGEMLNWDAPTGGYLLTACMASGRYAAQGVLHWLNQTSQP